ncbi:MAG: hypothetical protein JXB13_08645 [Phycisphaerae bacterium]|nr:hypothetical protein [Phycisphaerae bacterium]
MARTEIIRQILSHGWDAYVFGGTIRDIVVRGSDVRNRDVDVVVAGVETDELERLFRPHVLRRTRFGGLVLYRDGWQFDIWPLHETWAFRTAGSLDASFQHLPRTTFLNVEAIVVELGAKPGFPRRVFEHGFFRSISDRVVELNFPENPYPSLSVVRALTIARQLGFHLGPRIVQYILDRMRHIGIPDLLAAQHSHYGYQHFSANDFESIVATMRIRHMHAPDQPMHVPSWQQQSFLWATQDPHEDRLGYRRNVK